MNVVNQECQEEYKKLFNRQIKENTILQQRCQLLEIKLRESEERNQNIQKMNGTIMNVLNDYNSGQQKKQVSDLIKAQDHHTSKLLALNDKIKQLEQTNRNQQIQLQETIDDKNETTTRLEIQMASYIKQIGALEHEIKQHQQTIIQQKQNYEILESQLEDKDFEAQKIKLGYEVKIEELTEENQNLKDELKSLMGQVLKRTQSAISHYQIPPLENFKPKQSETEHIDHIKRIRSTNNTQTSMKTIQRPQSTMNKVTPKKTLWK